MYLDALLDVDEPETRTAALRAPDAPRFAITDAHVHIWNVDALRYPWLAAEPHLNRSFLPADFHGAHHGVDVERWVFVQADCDPDQGLAEARWVERQAEDDPRLAAIVAFAAVETGAALEPELARLRELPRVRGVRRLLQSEPDPAFCLQPAFVDGVTRLAAFDLSFDVCAFHSQLASVVELVRRCEDVTFVLDHAGKPGIRDGLLDPWRTHLRELSRQPNVWCKLSGLVTEADHRAWTAAQLRPYIDHVLECFGFERVLFGGDWPVSTLATTYPQWVDTVLALVAGCSAEDQRRLFRDNAVAVYRL